MRTAPLLGITSITFSALVLFVASSTEPSVLYLQSAQIGNSVGVQAGVEANELNSLAETLKNQEENLLRRERQIRNELRLIQESDTQPLLYLTIFMGFLFLLLILNFYQDHKRDLYREIHTPLAS